jgi:UDP-N-acetylmuramoyl-tripeptide--D-alanyl-D-alanine ligase
MDGGRKIAVLGDMLELGDHALAAHSEIGRKAAECGVDLLVTVGPLSRSTARGAVLAGLSAAAIKSFEASDEVGEALKDEINRGDVVLVKGSRGMKMEKVVEALIGN